MYQDILDQESGQPIGSQSNKAFWLFVLSLLTYAAPVYAAIAERNDNLVLGPRYSTFSGIVILVGYLLAIWGLIAGIRSVRRTEPRDYRQVIGVLGNALLILLMIAMIILVFTL